MAFESRPICSLAKGSIGSPIFRDWMGRGIRLPGTAGSLSAAGELARAMAGSKPLETTENTPAPLFGSPWKELWSSGLKDLLQVSSDVSGYAEIERRLAVGACSVVVTGQQPGFFGGPLYTLYKIATTIALARRRTAEGYPTVPVFWSGDDDDDLAEALSPVYWGPGDPELRRSGSIDARLMKNRRFRPIGSFPAKTHGAEVGRWLEMLVSGAKDAGTANHGLASDLAEIWSDAEAEEWSWAQLQHRALMRVFSGCGLVIVSGNDSTLHEAAGPLYERLLNWREDLAALARVRGEKLVAGGWHAQLSPRSLARPIFQLLDGQRTHLEPSATDVQPGQMRPGVLFRSLVQDWLLQPAAVVVGPGELAYLRQMDPLYEALDIPRAPLVPRLFGWLAPKGFDQELLIRHGISGAPTSAQLEEMADKVSSGAEEHLKKILTESLGMETSRATELAKGRARRYRKGVLALLGAESDRKVAAERPSDPIWVFPEGGRQERHLASFCAAALWGDDLVSGLLKAADDHLESGLRGAWSEYMIEV